MSTRYRLRWHPIDIDKHPYFPAHYIQEIDIVDLFSGSTVGTVEAFSTKDGIEAATEARRDAFRWIAERETEDAKSE